jgi:PAS domain S-box-containing protein
MSANKTKIGLKQGVLFFSLAAVILPILIIGSLFISYYKSSTLADINKENMRLAMAIRNDVTTFLNAPLRTVRVIARFSADPVHAAYLDDMISNLAESYGFFESIMLLDKNCIVRNLGTRKDITLNRRDYLGIDMSQAAHVQNTCRLKRYTWSDTSISTITGRPTLSLTLPFEQGVVVGSFDLSDLSRVVAPEQSGIRDKSFLVNSKGRIIAHKEHERVLRQDNVSDLPVVKAGLSGHEGVYQYLVDGKELISAVVKIPETGWLVVVERDRDEVLAPLRNMERMLFLALFCLTLLIVMFVMYVNAKVVRPIISISSATQSVTDGSFESMIVAESRFRELNTLTTNFNAMAAAIILRESELQEKNVELEQEIDERSRIEESLQERNEELTSMEEELRTQVDEYLQTHDQLLATEEMLRVQLQVVESSSQKFKAVFENSPITVALTTLPDGAFSEVNQAFVNMFGFSREEAIGKTTLELGVWLREEDRNRYLKLLRKNGLVSNFEVEMRRKGGEELTVIFSGAVIEIAGMPCALSAVMDISEQKRLQSQLNQTQKMEVIGQLAGGIAHDFNNMLAGIMASAELLKLRMADDERNMKMVNTILQAATRSADLTREMLSFSRKSNQVASQIPVNETINAVMNLLEHTIDRRIQLKSVLGVQNPIVMGDQSLLQNALLNLGVNARDAMPDGGILTYATAEKRLDEAACRACNIALKTGRYLEVTVSDTGVGMTRAIIERIFEPFYTTKEAGKGTGLGLAAVYGTVKNHGGDISVKSQPGLGSVFSIYLPLVSDETDKKALNDEYVTGSGGILLVDDEEMLREVGRDLLEYLGYSVYLASDGEQALEMFSANRDSISLVILDVIMPKMGGKETFLLLREKEPELKVLFCSGFSPEGTGDELLKLGAAGFIRKPYTRSELSRVVADVLS